MEDKIYKITLGDGTEISNLKLNGNNFISTEKIEESAFADNCSTGYYQRRNNRDCSSKHGAGSDC